jgi:hypothetical protein
MKSRLNFKHVVEILKQNKIYKRKTNRYDKDHVKYAHFIALSTEVKLENYECLYKKIKICN